MGYQVDFNKPTFLGREQEYMAEAIANRHISGDGPFTRRAQKILEDTFGVPRALLTTSCTHALEMAAFLLNLREGDEVIVPAFTFVSTVNAFVIRGAKPVFADIRPDTLNLDEKQLPELITPRTRAIVPVHYAGVGCAMEEILAVAAQAGAAVVEDNAHGLYGKYKGRWLGTFGTLATQSFHETKNIICGEGGALLVNDPALAERAEILREKGTNRSRYFRGQVDKYTWVDVGSSYVLSDLLAAFLTAQLEVSGTIQERRRQIWQTYAAALPGWAAEQGIRLPVVPEEAEQAWHMFYLLLPSLEQRTRFIAFLKERGVLSVFHYLPLNLSDMGRKFGGREGQCPVTEDIADRLVRLPFYTTLTPDDLERAIDAVLAFKI